MTSEVSAGDFVVWVGQGWLKNMWNIDLNLVVEQLCSIPNHATARRCRADASPEYVPVLALPRSH